MTLTAKHIECAHVCARLEVAGIQDTKRMAAKCGVARATIYNWFQCVPGPKRPDEAAADVEGMIESLQVQLDLLERQRQSAEKTPDPQPTGTMRVQIASAVLLIPRRRRPGP